MNPKIITITTLLIGLAAGMIVGTFVTGPLIDKPSNSAKSSSSNCQPETVVLSNAYPYSTDFFVTLQNAGPGTVTLSSYGVSSPSWTDSSGKTHSAYIYNGTTFDGPTANPAIGSGITIKVNANMGPGWTSGAPTTITIVTSCNNKFPAQIGY